MIDWPLVVAGLVAENLRLALSADLVFAAWWDRTKPMGIDYLLLKGDLLMDQIEERGGVGAIELSLVRVEDEAEAIALQKQVRERGNGGF